MLHVIVGILGCVGVIGCMFAMSIERPFDPRDRG